MEVPISRENGAKWLQMFNATIKPGCPTPTPGAGAYSHGSHAGYIHTVPPTRSGEFRINGKQNISFISIFIFRICNKILPKFFPKRLASPAWASSKILLRYGQGRFWRGDRRTCSSKSPREPDADRSASATTPNGARRPGRIAGRITSGPWRQDQLVARPQRVGR